ncbi:hypothetical protein ABFS82_10G130900 [Erythranthe guttata]|uniref:N-acetyltransferase domain-containing protein n=1 Tax=Erythranthe guttata TaxID=4155 RepID=A0A022R9U2_ERYGU|nr:PREDICTED: uncharacterized protein LOC105958371 [Erythranthe guttata]EYU37112.1 hypothetical protein MIMGU_mgv1a010916mg [Erythranthe guttata]|eukprot:XP_012837834.1 PREDICTED: uncharacterized protein LOC105958371 [Erythranthe guttata]
MILDMAITIHIPSPSPPSFSAPHASASLRREQIHGGAAFPVKFPRRRPPALRSLRVNCQLADQRVTPPAATPAKTSRISRPLLSVSETTSEAELWAAVCLRVRTFYDFKEPTFGIEDHKKYLVEREFEALKERVSGLRKGFRKVSCINATLPISLVLNISEELSASCKFSQNGADRVVVGTLDLNQCLSLPDEMIGTKPKGIGADFARAYISNVCVAEELQRNGLGYELIADAKRVAQEWGISDLYVHVAVDNEAAKKLYIKSGFTIESDEPAWQARFLDRPRRLLLWTALPIPYEL